MFKIQMRKIFFVLLFYPFLAHAESSSLNLQLPSTPGNYSSDKFRSGEMDCSNAIGGATQLEFGMTGVIDNYSGPFGNNSGDSTKDVGEYARITIPLDAPKERINCNTLYQLELKKKRLEIQRLEAELAKLRELQGNGGQ